MKNVQQVAHKALRAYLGAEPVLPIWPEENPRKGRYNIPVPPPAPSIVVSSKPDMIVIEWGTKSEEAADFAGYKIYRAKGLNYYSEEEGVVNGEWKMIKEFEGSSTHYYEDKEVDRSVAYYYYVSAYSIFLQNLLI